MADKSQLVEVKAMYAIMIKFASDVQSDSVRETLEKIRAMEGITQAAALSPESKAPSSRRMGFVRVDEGSPVQSVIEQLKALTLVENAYVPAERGLLSE